MKIKKGWIGVAAAAALLVAGCSSSSTATEATEASSSAADVAESAAPEGVAAASAGAADGECGPVDIAIVAAKTGLLGLFDVASAEAFTMAIDEVNAAGGVCGEPITYTWTDTKSDPALTKQIAEKAAADGATLIVGSCDFDFSAPALTVAQANGLAALSLCGEDPKLADKRTIGDLALTPSPGNQFNGSAAAEWAFNQMGWRNAYILQDDLLEYNKSLARYFKARWEEMGGSLVGEDVYTGNEQLDPSANVSRLRDGAANADVIVLPSLVPAATTMIKAIRDAGIDTPIFMPGSATDGVLVTDSLPDISNFYSVPFACMPPTCTGDPNPAVQKFADMFKEKYGKEPILTYPVLSYELGRALGAAIQQAGSTDGASIIKAFETLPPTDYLTGPIAWSEACHATTGRQLRVTEYQNGKGTFAGLITPEKIANVDPDNNPCEAAQSNAG